MLLLAQASSEQPSFLRKDGRYMNTKRRKQRQRRIMIVVGITLLLAVLLIWLMVWMWNAISQRLNERSHPSSSGSSTPAASDSSSPSSSPSPDINSTASSSEISSADSSTTSSGLGGYVDADGHYIQGKGTPWNLVLANDWNALPGDYDSTFTAEEFYSYGGEKKMDIRAIEHMREMIEAGNREGLQLKVLSAYRSVELQARLYNKKVQEYLNRGYSQEQAEIKAATVVKRPGTSEHNTGLAADLGGSGDNSITESFENTAAFRWLKEHCAEYGFILRFPKDKEDITGVIYEPWHYRYVGVEHAKIIMENHLCLEEYLRQLDS